MHKKHLIGGESMSIEQIIRITVAGVILYVMLVAMGEIETLKWMMMVIGLTVIAMGVSTMTKKE